MAVIQILIVITILVFVLEFVHPHLRRLGEDMGALIVASSREEYLKTPSSLDEAKTRIRRIRLVRTLAWFCLRGKERKSHFDKLKILRRETGEFIVVELSKRFRKEMLRLAAAAEEAIPSLDRPHYTLNSVSLAWEDLKKGKELLRRISVEAYASGLVDVEEALLSEQVSV